MPDHVLMNTRVEFRINVRDSHLATILVHLTAISRGLTSTWVYTLNWSGVLLLRRQLTGRNVKLGQREQFGSNYRHIVTL